MVLPKEIDTALDEMLKVYKQDAAGIHRKGELFTIAQDVSKEELLAICIMEHKILHKYHPTKKLVQQIREKYNEELHESYLAGELDFTPKGKTTQEIYDLCVIEYARTHYPELLEKEEGI